MALARAHLALLRVELGGIASELKVIAALAGAIFAIAMFVGMLLTVGGTLFVGEWLFGSIGWGVLDGLLISVAVIVATAMVLVRAPRRVVTAPLGIAVVAGVVVALLLGTNAARNAATAVADRLRAGSSPHLDPAWAPVVVGVVVGAVVVGLVGLVVAGRAGGGGAAVAGLVLGALGGALLGWWMAGVHFSWHGAAAVGVTVGIAAWIALMPVWMLREHVDPTARFRRLWPKESYETAMETKSWLESEWTKRRAKLGRT